MRGNRHDVAAAGVPLGSIPAHAGKPCGCTGSSLQQKVYPRPCGETTPPLAVTPGKWGLSPPMRGNRVVGPARPHERGSIPAHAGKPSHTNSVPRVARVYPRPCGETEALRHTGRPEEGLSPPMRGNHAAEAHGENRRGSIPAHAGKPRHYGTLDVLKRVYPRPCGETATSAAGLVRFTGLSPPMRGNRGGLDAPGKAQGSIPAHAGKPRAGPRAGCRPRVYPRPCGETLKRFSRAFSRAGLSPPMRGNLGEGAKLLGNVGSIPAHAGKPGSGDPGPVPEKVYPRPCGETRVASSSAISMLGLSPPMRGNPQPPVERAQLNGSIPAHAGKPVRRRAGSVPATVYPRPCGETVGGV